MSEMMFEDIGIPDDEMPSDIPDVPQEDTAPAVYEHACQVCGKELHYAGVGRKPKFCDEHKKSKTTSTRTTASKRTDTTAREAAEVLSQVNNLLAVGLQIAPGPFNFPATGQAITEKSDKFTEEAYRALLASPELARSIARAGGLSGSAGLVMAYGILAVSLAPIAQAEWKAKREGNE